MTDDALEERIARIFERRTGAAIVPEAPRPITEGYGWESTDWSECPLALRYGIPGRDRHIEVRKVPRL